MPSIRQLGGRSQGCRSLPAARGYTCLISYVCIHLHKTYERTHRQPYMYMHTWLPVSVFHVQVRREREREREREIKREREGEVDWPSLWWSHRSDARIRVERGDREIDGEGEGSRERERASEPLSKGFRCFCFTILQLMPQDFFEWPQHQGRG